MTLGVMGNSGRAMLSMPSTSRAKPIPAKPPNSYSAIASPTNIPSNWRRDVPMARSKPISGMRSARLVVITVNIPTPPTMSEIDPSAAMPRVSIDKMRFKLASISSWVTKVKSSWP